MFARLIICKFIVLSFMLTGHYTDIFAHNEYWQQRVTLFDCLSVKSSDIVFLGNSITDGGEFYELFGNNTIKNRGISGDVIRGVRDRLYQVVSGCPKKIFLLIGINDISHNIPVDKLAMEYDELVRSIREGSPDTKLYIQSVMPINNDFGRYKNLLGKENDVMALNIELSKIADRYDATYIDLFPVLAEEGSNKLNKLYTNDGLHLIGDGYVVWTEYIRHYVEE